MAEALSVADAGEWRQAMGEETSSLREKGNCIDEGPPSNMRSIKTGYVSILHLEKGGEIERY